jgi:alkanesulfonate monooxygenase SsuD/methylene tetrahydromethanopterin reductase-like flavin-dependent oxidoreductase (luciferase family)
VVAETDAEALATARPAFARWRASLSALWDRRGVAFPVPMPTQWDELEAKGMAIAGSPQRAAAFSSRTYAATGGNFFLCQMMFGDMPLEFAQHSARLFAFEVAPLLA